VVGCGLLEEMGSSRLHPLVLTEDERLTSQG